MISGVVITSPGMKKRGILMNAAATSIAFLGPEVERIIRGSWTYTLGRSGAAGEPPWQALAASTLEATPDRRLPKPFATRTQKMWRSFTKKTSPEAYHFYAAAYIDVGSKNRIAPFHAARRTKPGTAWVLPKRAMELSKHAIGRIVKLLAASFAGRSLKQMPSGALMYRK